MNKKAFFTIIIVITVVVALVYINVTTPDNIAHIDESTILTTDNTDNK